VGRLQKGLPGSQEWKAIGIKNRKLWKYIFLSQINTTGDLIGL
jgi:hypothetical protein